LTLCAHTCLLFRSQFQFSHSIKNPARRIKVGTFREYSQSSNQGKGCVPRDQGLFDLVDMATLAEKRVNESLVTNELKRLSITFRGRVP